MGQMPQELPTTTELSTVLYIWVMLSAAMTGAHERDVIVITIRSL